MLILLPPSETKRAPDRGPVLDLSSRPAPLRGATAAVLDALVSLCREDVATASAVLGLSPGQASLVELDARLPDAPTGPAGEVYTGVLYDALDFPALPAAARRRGNQAVWVASALFGVVPLAERIPAYRLSAGTALPGLPPLARLWRPAIDAAVREVDPPLILDLRSGPYAALWPIPADLRDRTLTGKVWQRGTGGRRTAVSHHNKAHKGALVASLLRAGKLPRRPARLLDAVRAAGWDAQIAEGRLDLTTSA